MNKGKLNALVLTTALALSPAAAQLRTTEDPHENTSSVVVMSKKELERNGYKKVKDLKKATDECLRENVPEIDIYYKLIFGIDKNDKKGKTSYSKCVQEDNKKEGKQLKLLRPT